MINIYYQLWVDGIVNSKDYKKKSPSWKFLLFMIITICNSLNFYTIYLWLKFYGIFSYMIKIDFFPGTIFNNVVSFIVQFASPFILLNYFLIFYKDRYKKLIEKYHHKKGKLAMLYTLLSALIWLVTIILYGAFN